MISTWFLEGAFAVISAIQESDNLPEKRAPRMRKLILAFIWTTAVFAQQSQKAPSINIVSSRPGLVLVAFASDGFALAADGAQLNADGTVSQANKLFPMGKHGAVLIAGTTSIQDLMNRRVREELNVTKIVPNWLEGHPDMSAETAERALNSEVVKAAYQFFSAPDRAAQHKKYTFDLIIVGLKNGRPHLSQNHYVLPGSKNQRTMTSTTMQVEQGAVWAYGASRVAGELLSRSGPALKNYKREPAVKKFLTAKATELTVRDFQALFDVILRAADSPEGKRLDRGALVAPPSKSASITQEDGFAWRHR